MQVHKVIHAVSYTEIISIKDPNIIFNSLKSKGFDITKPITEIYDDENERVIFKQKQLKGDVL